MSNQLTTSDKQLISTVNEQVGLLLQKSASDLTIVNTMRGLGEIFTKSSDSILCEQLAKTKKSLNYRQQPYYRNDLLWNHDVLYELLPYALTP